jgi:hypothetical protein
MRISWVVFTGLAAVVTGCQGSDPPAASILRPIVAGAPDTGDPAIMEVLSYKGNIGARCTATLVTPRVLLLAAHCFVETPGFAQRFVFPGSDDRNVPDKDLLPITTFVFDPQYTTPRQGHDFAVVVLDAPLAVRPVAINRAPLEPAAGKTVRYVGYGLNTVGDRSTGGVKRQNSAPLATVSGLLLSIAPNPHPDCEGDSGGPLLLDSGQGESIVGVGSFVTNPACLRDTFFQRVDTQLAWLDAQIQKYDPGGIVPGDGGVRDGSPASQPDATSSGTQPDADEIDLAPSMAGSMLDARPRDVAPPPVSDPEPPTVGTKPGSGGGCGYGGRAGSGGSGAVLLVCLVRRYRRRRV